MANSNVKVTKKDYFNTLLSIPEVVEIEGMADFITHEIELLSKKSGSASDKKVAEHKAEEDVVLNALAFAPTPITVTDLIKVSDTLDGMSSSKVTAVLQRLLKDGKVVNTKEGKKSFYSLVEVED